MAKMTNKKQSITDISTQDLTANLAKQREEQAHAQRTAQHLRRLEKKSLVSLLNFTSETSQHSSLMTLLLKK
jgi:hypothetical protein